MEVSPGDSPMDRANSRSDRKCLRRVLLDPQASDASKDDALIELIMINDPELPEMFTKEITRSDISDQWFDILILATGMIQFSTDSQRSRVANRLYTRAMELMWSHESYPTTILLTAIRNYVSLVSPKEVPKLLMFLQVGARLPETIRVVLQSIWETYVVYPPDPKTTSELKEYVEVLWKHMLFIPPKIPCTSLTLNAFLALAVLGSPLASVYAVGIGMGGPTPLTRRIIEVLSEIRFNWESQGASAWILSECIHNLQEGKSS
jgi:hypothetical protein